MNDNLKKTSAEISYQEYVMREEGSFHASYGPEFDFYFAVKNGNIDRVKEFNKEKFSSKVGFGTLSSDPLQNLKYHFVVTAALLARYCIEGGLEHELSYTLSDVYIQKADKSKSIYEIDELQNEMVMDFATRMLALSKSKTTSKAVSDCMEYIYNNLHTNITLSDLAEFCGLNPSYLSRLFKSETGSDISSYIAAKKISTAENMLKFSDYSIAQITNILAYSSQSYFSTCFKKATGFTPIKYRDKFHRELKMN